MFIVDIFPVKLVNTRYTLNWFVLKFCTHSKRFKRFRPCSANSCDNFPKTRALLILFEGLSSSRLEENGIVFEKSKTTADEKPKREKAAGWHVTPRVRTQQLQPAADTCYCARCVPYAQETTVDIGRVKIHS